jgi:branched-chain amino acid transport system ATP-binding protein
MSELLSVRDVSLTIGGVDILRGIDLVVEQEEAVGIIGPNGAGKTSLFNVVTGFMRCTGGEVVFDGRSLAGVPPHRVPRLGLVRTFQNVGGFGDLTVAANLELASRGRDAAATADAVELLGLAPFLKTRVTSCSLATRKLVGIALAVVQRPRLLFLDEPLAGLDSDDRDHVVEMVRRVHATGVTVCLIEHDIPRTRALVGRLIVLDAGTKVADGHPDEIAARGDLAKAYLL